MVTIAAAASLVAGIVLSDLLWIGGGLALWGYPFGLWIVAAGATAILGRFLPAFLRTRKPWPALTMAVPGAVTAVLALAALLGAGPSGA